MGIVSGLLKWQNLDHYFLKERSGFKEIHSVEYLETLENLNLPLNTCKMVMILNKKRKEKKYT